MKQSREIIGLPIISIKDGKEFGKVKGLVINSLQHTVEFLLVENEKLSQGEQAIPFKLIEGIGGFAVTIEKSSAIIDLQEIPVAIELLSKNIHIIGTKIITRKGRLIGSVDEYIVNEDTGIISGLTFRNERPEENRVIPKQSVITFGQELTIVNEEVEQEMLLSMEELGIESKASNVETTLETNTNQAWSAPESVQPKVEIEPVSDVQEGQRHLIVGKTVNAELRDEEGNLIVGVGEVITDEVFDRVKALGRLKLIELTLKVVG